MEGKSCCEGRCGSDGRAQGGWGGREKSKKAAAAVLEAGDRVSGAGARE